MGTRLRRLRNPRILIAGLGNELLQDDGVGVHAVRELRKAPPPGILVLEVGTAVLSALHAFEWADRILALDAMQAGGPAGAIYACDGDDVAGGGIQASLHELGLLAALRFLPPDKQPQVAVLGVEPQTIDYSMELSPAVQASLPRLVRAAWEIATRWKTLFSS